MCVCSHFCSVVLSPPALPHPPNLNAFPTLRVCTQTLQSLCRGLAPCSDSKATLWEPIGYHMGHMATYRLLYKQASKQASLNQKRKVR